MKLDLKNIVFEKEVLREAIEDWEDISKTHEGQVLLINAAKDGDFSARTYILYKNFNQVSTVFWNNYLGPNEDMRRVRILSGDADVFASIVKEMLLKSESGSPFYTFDPSIYSEKTNIIPKIGYYIYQYLIQACISENKKTYNKGMTKAPKDLEYSDFDMLANDAEISAALQQVTPEMIVDAEDAWGSFIRKLKADKSKGEDTFGLDSGKPPTVREVLEAILAQDKFEVRQIAAKHEVTTSTVRNKLRRLDDILNEFAIDFISLLVLLKHVGKDSLLRDFKQT